MNKANVGWALTGLLSIFLVYWTAIILVCHTSPIHAEVTANVMLNQSNPAADYCVEQNGQLRKVELDDEWIDVCELLDDQLIEHWLFYYRREQHF